MRRKEVNKSRFEKLHGDEDGGFCSPALLLSYM